MQGELDAERHELDIQILTVNEVGYESGLDDMAALGDLPLLQDTEEVLVWEAWEVTFRDVHILDGDNFLYGVFNLTTYSLAVDENYEALKALFIAAAESSSG